MKTNQLINLWRRLNRPVIDDAEEVTIWLFEVTPELILEILKWRSLDDDLEAIHFLSHKDDNADHYRC